MMLRSVSNWRIGLEMVEINERCESHVRVFFHCFKKYQGVVIVLYFIVCLHRVHKKKLFCQNSQQETKSV